MATLRCNFNYRFTCEACDRTTEWIERPIEESSGSLSDSFVEFVASSATFGGSDLPIAQKKLKESIAYCKEQCDQGNYFMLLKVLDLRSEKVALMV